MEHGINYFFLQTKKPGSSVPESALKKYSGMKQAIAYCFQNPCLQMAIALFLLRKHSPPKAVCFAERTAVEFCAERIYFGMWTQKWFKDMT